MNFSRFLSDVRKPQHHCLEVCAHDRCRAAANGFDRARNFARRRPPKGIGREPQHTETETDHLFPGEGRGLTPYAYAACGSEGFTGIAGASAPNVAAISA